ncbi:hypothetical protein [Pseudomonas aeruginosa]|uniref:hypothetical protein n=1 Tax=Pseudomonas aeruginosa TaxID=287 RepID=UPI0034E05CC6
MPTNKSAAQYAQEIIEKLAVEGVSAFIEKPQDGKDDPDDDFWEGEFILRVPAWEAKDGSLSRKACYEFIHSKLAGRSDAGYVVGLPGLSYCDVYCYYPLSVENGKQLSCWDLLVCGASSKLELFDWSEAVEGDDSAWWNGWDLPTGLDHLPKRVGTLALLLSYTIEPLPALVPFTEQELIDKLKSLKAGSGLFCMPIDLNDRWTLRLSEAGRLELHKASDQSVTPITAANFDEKGRLVLGEHILKHRCWGY